MEKISQQPSIKIVIDKLKHILPNGENLTFVTDEDVYSLNHGEIKIEWSPNLDNGCYRVFGLNQGGCSGDLLEIARYKRNNSGTWEYQQTW